MRPFYDEDGIQIFHADCREAMKELVAVDHVITDPPYARDVYLRMAALMAHADAGSVGGGGLRESGRPFSKLAPVAIGKMAAGDIGAINDMLEAVAGEIARLTRRWALVFSDAESIHRWREALTTHGLRYVRTGAWVKPDPMPQMTGDRPGVGFEPCTICHGQGAMRWNGGGKAAAWTHGTVKSNRPEHPCPKPEPLMRELVSQFTDEGETILDPFMGSGTTLVAAKRLGRKAIGIEIEEKYCEIAARRLAQRVLPLEHPA